MTKPNPENNVVGTTGTSSDPSSFKMYDSLPQEMQHELDCILIRQKDEILQALSESNLRKAYWMLSIVSELWISCEYEYKLRELQQILDLRTNLRQGKPF
jgi:hypothetical protein